LKRKVRGKVLKRIVRKKVTHKCFFCGKTTHLEQHSIIFQRFLAGQELENNKEWVCKDCHKKLHKIMQPLVTILLSAIEKLQPHEMNKIGFRFTPTKGGK